MKSVKPEKFSVSGNDTDFQAFLDQFEVCARMNGWNEEEKANQLILCMKEKARVVMSTFVERQELLRVHGEGSTQKNQHAPGSRSRQSYAQGPTKKGGRNFVRLKH